METLLYIIGWLLWIAFGAFLIALNVFLFWAAWKINYMNYLRRKEILNAVHTVLTREESIK